MSESRGLAEAERNRQQREREQTTVCMREHREHWQVIDYHCNYSAFNGYHHTHSDYSACRCTECGRRWRTKAAYVEDLPDAPEGWWR